MQVLIFFNSNDHVVHRLQSELRPFSRFITIKYFNNFNMFNLSLRGSLISETIVVFCITDEKCLRLAHSIKRWLVKTKLLLVFQNNDPSLVSQVSDLYPRYYTFASGDLKDVKAVIARMIDNVQPPNSKADPVRSGHKALNEKNSAARISHSQK
jgi:hypothetical protein